ncbi:MAG: LysR family transcriptional regulator [Polyangiaceae bacterium]
MDRLERMTAFARVAEMESFTSAAKSLGLPKATVSLAVQRLEERLGVRLLHRTTRRVHLTQDGVVFYERCKALLADAEDVETLFQRQPEALTGRIRVDMPSRMARLHVIPKLPLFLDKHPAVELELGSTDRSVDLVREGYDCVVRVGPLTDSDLVARRIGEYRIVNVASAAYLKQHGTPRSVQDLTKHHLVHWAPVLGAKPFGFEYRDGNEQKELSMRGRITVNNAEAYLAACIAGLGIIQLPKVPFDEELTRHRLVEILPKLQRQTLPVTILLPHRRQLSRRVRVFIEWLEHVLK